MQASHHLGELANEKTANNLLKDFILLKAVKQTSWASAKTSSYDVTKLGFDNKMMYIPNWS